MMIIDRIRDNGVVNYGVAAFYRNKVETPFEFVTVEPTDLFNQPFVSCILAGEYDVVPHVSPTFGQCFLVKNVPGRDNILIHPLNFFNQTEGCIGVGSRFAHLDKDHVLDTVDSQKTMKKLLELANGKPFKLFIREHPKKQVFYVAGSN